MIRAATVGGLLLAACGGGGNAAPVDGLPGAGDAQVGPDAQSAADAAPETSDQLYDPAIVPTFELTLDAEAIDALTVAPLTYAHATLRYGDEVLTDIGVRLKGEYNFRPLGAKASFKLKFDEFVPGQRFHGLRRLTLNGAIEDPSWLAERLAYFAFRAADLPAPRANSAWLTVNGDPYGLYVNVETEDKQFVQRWFADDEGNLYEELGVDLEPGNETGFELETDATANDRSDLTALFAAIAAAADDSFLADVTAVLDPTAFLRYCAYEGATWQWDGYCYGVVGPNNFRLYHDPSSAQFQFIPWGMDLAWKPFQPSLDYLNVKGLVLARCLASVGCNAAYRAELLATADRIEALDLPALVDSWGDQIRALVAQDPMTAVSPAAFEDALAEVRAQAAARPDEIRGQVQ